MRSHKSIYWQLPRLRYGAVAIVPEWRQMPISHVVNIFTLMSCIFRIKFLLYYHRRSNVVFIFLCVCLSYAVCDAQHDMRSRVSRESHMQGEGSTAQTQKNRQERADIVYKARASIK